MDIARCTCIRQTLPEVLAQWQARVVRVVARMARRGRLAPLERLKQTARLIALVQKGDPEAFSEANYGRSHHLPGCPFSPKRPAITQCNQPPCLSSSQP